jgi:nitroreductase
MIKTDFLQIARQRESVRAYIDRKVDRKKIVRCIEAAQIAPSACNSQPWKFIIVDDEFLKNKIAETTSNKLLPLNHFTKQAPVHVVVVREKANFTSKMGQIIREKDFPSMDIGIATEHFCLQAVSEGLGTCMLGWFDVKKVQQLLNIPVNKRAELIITVGYPKNNQTRTKKRKSLDEIMTFNSY